MYIMCVMFVQRFEPRGSHFTNFHGDGDDDPQYRHHCYYYYHNENMDVGAGLVCLITHIR